MEQTECSETSARKTQMPGNYPEESIQHSEQGKNLKSRIYEMLDIKIYSNKTVQQLILHILQTIFESTKYAE